MYFHFQIYTFGYKQNQSKRYSFYFKFSIHTCSCVQFKKVQNYIFSNFRFEIVLYAITEENCPVCKNSPSASSFKMEPN